MRWREVLTSMDWVLLGAALLLVLLGLAMLFSSTDTSELLSSRFIRQALALVVAVSLSLVVARLPYHTWRGYAVGLYLVGIGGLLAVYFAAQVIRGTASRLELFGFQLQPSEFMKVAFILLLAWLLARQRHFSWWGMMLSVGFLTVPVALILLEPDLGVAMLLVALWAGIVVFWGLPWWALGLLGAGAGVSLAAAWRWFFADYQRIRLLVFLDPSRDPLGAGYNVVQSIVALGSGRWWGRGLGHGPQSQLQFLPERHTDFILASIGEELGWIGVVLVLVLYGIVLWRVLRVARTTQDSFGQVIAVGTFLALLMSLVVSGGMNMGLLPVTGIPLPFLSYGGSSLVTTFLLLGMVESVHVYSKWVQPPPRELLHFT